MLTQDLFIHHVYFWLERPDSAEDHAALLAGLQALSAAPSIQQFHIGVPANTHRDVIETGYAFSWLAVFPDKAAQDAYQVDPIHLHFVDTCKQLWKKVVVYDSIAAY
ncbi:MAG TPA: Dabb family protein [Sediminibacterium sp.]|nr:Dabb family protein [Sediminibacterium sp.]